MNHWSEWGAQLGAALPSAKALGYWLAAGWSALIIVQTLYVIMQRRSPVATLGWIIALNLLPVVGLIGYRIFGPMRVRRQQLKRERGIAALSSHKERLALREEHPHPPLWAVQHSRLIEQACGIPMSSARTVTLLRDGVATLASMLQAVAAARKHIHLEYYIFEPDQVGTPLRDALIAKLKDGAQVRLLVDAMGSPKMAGRFGRTFLKEYLALGGEFAVFHPTRLAALRPVLNLRTHRKILICDGVVGFTGGINITETENEALRADAYRDTHLRLDGAAVRWLQLVFLEDWAYAHSNGKAAGPAHLKLAADLIVQTEPGPTAVQIVASGPDTNGEAIHRAVIDALHSARHRVWITTPYFVPTEGALYALTAAALRGVDVKLLVPRRSDSRLVTAAAQSYFEELQAAGVKVFEYQARMLHSKTLLIDDQYGQVGTANFDHRSFRLNFEVAVALFDAGINAQLAADFEHDLRHSSVVARQSRLPWPERFMQAVARLFSPIL
ncbi:MAG: cardiolipin synthase [Burkholderiales bacterium]|nr:cardiolipin synthase [Burkholderiales bacterium]MDE2394428.1 cardiolipin synthase [Burkholderiales bacterium]MDE2455736.1 cardiolipin synthase [Burkholderiales bacterium]